jgi:hypothetical protein
LAGAHKASLDGAIDEIERAREATEQQAGAYENNVPSLPPALNSLSEIRPVQALWIRVSKRTELAGPAA